MPRKMTVRQARKTLDIGSADEKEAVKNELLAIGAANITDVLSWDATGGVSLKSSKSIPAHIQKAIKKVKIKPGEFGNEIEVEMHDKISALRVMARYYGLTEPNSDSDTRPSILGINMKGPQVTEYEVVEDGQSSRIDGPESETEEEGDTKDQGDLF